MIDKKLGLLDEDLAIADEIINSECNIFCRSEYGKLSQIFGPASSWVSFDYLPRNAIGLKDSTNVTLTAIHKSDPTQITLFKMLHPQIYWI
ncbi:MAG: hypothetical protein IPL13_06160 [Saprospiraceae bacterium]|nr:hypothetical protein [Candidatus Brachybacter algidus]